ncbi:uncharacterized protein UBRO_20550 [Ustilago bromivora]|uniref:Uncharacterized protein n=1 Tax=Ustilago bromivora TaxID=307758 RepID=A0A1K0FZV0_9BASI|nr:uncharacterized protein UBRO_20550 [Ustilago bromivora]
MYVNYVIVQGSRGAVQSVEMGAGERTGSDAIKKVICTPMILLGRLPWYPTFGKVGESRKHALLRCAKCDASRLFLQATHPRKKRAKSFISNSLAFFILFYFYSRRSGRSTISPCSTLLS